MTIPASNDGAQPDPLLVTKLYIPPASAALVPRPRLTERLNEGARRKLTLVSAPAGFGKTTMLSEWIHQRRDGSPLLLAWISLDERDNDPARFWAYFVAALETLQAGVGEAVMALLHSSPPPPIETILTALINTTAAIPHDFAVVLDDYHLIESRPIHCAVAFLLEHLPPSMHLVIAGRADPPLPLARLRAHGQMIELRAADLRFTPDEAAAFLNSMGLKLAADQVSALEARTEGWVAALQLAALSMKGLEDIPGFIAAFAGDHRYILDYLVEEVLERQPESVRAFLQQTSVLDRMTGLLCDAITGGSDGQAMLNRLEHANLFIVPLDDRHHWYRYHHLFADFLRACLKQMQAEQVPELHRRACEWCERHGLATEAVGHALAAQDFERATRLIEQAARSLLGRGEVITLLNWVEALPDELVRSRPQLCLFHARALLFSLQMDAAERRLQDALANESERQPLPAGEAAPTQSIIGEATTIRALITTYRGDISLATQLLRQAVDLLPGEGNSFSRSVIAINKGFLSALNGDVLAATGAFDEAARIGQEDGNALIAMFALYARADMQRLQGQLRQAAATYRQALQLGGGQEGQPLPVAATGYIGMGELLREWNDLDTSARYLAAGIELFKQWGQSIAFDGYIALARVKQAQGDTAGALNALQEAEQLAPSVDFTGLSDATVAAHQARLWVAQGNVEAAGHWAQASARNSSMERSYSVGELERIGQACVFIAQGKSDPVGGSLPEALRLLESLLLDAERLGRMGSAIEILSLQAVAYQALGDVGRAIPVLERALALAEPEGYVRIFVDLGEPMALLLTELAQGHRDAPPGASPTYILKLLAAFEPVATPPHAAEPSPILSAVYSLPEPLTERELEVLSLMAAGKSNQEIAQELVIAVSTVRSHVTNIYGKLGVSNRVQAAMRARALNLAV